MLATLGAGNAESIGALIGWRTLQGMGGGLLIPIGQTLTYQLYRSHERAGLSAAIMLVRAAGAGAVTGAGRLARRSVGLALGVSPTCRWRLWPWRWRRCGCARKRRRRRVNRSTPRGC